jgi:ankyrin repeat protein
MNNNQKNIKEAIKLNNIKEIELLIDTAFFTADYREQLIGLSLCYDNIEVFKLLLEHRKNNPSKYISKCFQLDAIQLASQYGKVDILKVLLKEDCIDPSHNDSYSFRLAATHNYIPVMKLLLKDNRINPSDGFNYSIIESAKNGHVETIKYLLKDSRVDPSDRDNCGIRQAYYNNHLNIVSLLINNNKVKKLLIKNNPIFYEELQKCLIQYKIKNFHYE